MTIRPFFHFYVALTLALVAWPGSRLEAQVQVLRVEPAETDTGMENVHSPHLAVYDTNAVSRHRLFLFLPGTGAKATNTLALARVFAEWGYHIISLDYENNVMTVACAHSLDPATFDRYRNAIVTGAPVSSLVRVDPANSILNRVQKLLVYLAKHDPKGGWDEFVEDGRPAWSRMIVAGHSQGSGHAVYLGKRFAVDRVLIFSGPQDYMDDLHRPAPWLGDKSATPPSHFFAFLSQNDPFNVDHQIANCRLLMQPVTPNIMPIEPGESIGGGHHIFVNHAPKKQAHGSTLALQYTNVWQYMVTENNP